MNKPFKNITVIGTGTLGTQIALLAGNSGYAVTVYDFRTGILSETLNRLRSSIETKGIKPFVPWEQLEKVRDRIRETTNLDEAVRNADLIVESVPEDLNIKQAHGVQQASVAP